MTQVTVNVEIISRFERAFRAGDQATRRRSMSSATQA
jgi:hypothetical protein